MRPKRSFGAGIQLLILWRRRRICFDLRFDHDVIAAEDERLSGCGSYRDAPSCRDWCPWSEIAANGAVDSRSGPALRQVQQRLKIIQNIS